MARVEERTADQVRREIQMEREQLAEAVDSLRTAVRMRARLPVAAAAVLGTGLVLRSLFRRGRER